MRRRLLVIVLCASLIGLVASFLVYKVVSRVAGAKSDQFDHIVVAAAKIGLAESITRQHVKLVPWPKSAIPPGAIRTVEDAEGRVVRGSIAAGEPLIEAKLASQLAGKGGIMPMLVPEGQRGVTIKLDEAMRESGFLLPDSRVDVLVSMPKGPGSNEKIAKVILQDVAVLAAGQTVEIKDNKPVTSTTVTMALTPQQAERLAVAQSDGKLMLVQRNLRDTDVVRTPGATPSSLLTDAASEAPKPGAKAVVARSAPLPLPAIEKYPVAVVRGSKVTEQVFVRERNSWSEQHAPRSEQLAPKQ
jgi:pilus assembly protein CpaB